MKILLSFLLVLQSMTIAFANPAVSSTTLQDILVSYNYEVQASGNNSIEIEDKFKELIKDYYQSVGSAQFGTELSTFISTLPNSEETEQLLELVDLQQISPEETLAIIDDKKLIEKSLAGDSANWTNKPALKYGVFIALVLATIVIVAVLTAGDDLAEIPGDYSGTTTNDDGSVTVYKRFTSSRTDLALTELDCNQSNSSVQSMIQSVTSEVIAKCTSDADLIAEGGTHACESRVYTEVRWRFAETCDVYGEIYLTFTL